MSEGKALKGCGHGHVYPNPDKSKTRCGGPRMCVKCAQDDAEKRAKEMSKGIEPHAFTGKREWGLNPSDDKRCTVCNIAKGDHYIIPPIPPAPGIEPLNIDPYRLAQIQNSHIYHPPTPETIAVHEEVRRRVLDLDLWLEQNTKPGRFQSLARTHIEEFEMWAHKSIACDGVPGKEDRV